MVFLNQRRSDSPRIEPSSYVGVEPLLRLTLLRSVLATTMSFPCGGDVVLGEFYLIWEGARNGVETIGCGAVAEGRNVKQTKKKEKRRKGGG